ncbi:MAG TPA: DUF1820 family protein [Burkholderiales bacterium]|nr:DUF1820 family protein [Burkholderiales bacterium]
MSKSAAAQKRLYKVIFVNQGKVYEVYARHVSQGNLFGFVEIEQLVFGEKSAVVIDPTEERLRNEFEGVKVSYLPLHAVIRIDEVERPGNAKIFPLSGKSDDVVPFPTVYPGGPTPKKGGGD